MKCHWILMMGLGMFLVTCAMVAPTGAQLIITGVVDGPLPGGLPKALELYVAEDISDLGRYALGSANNGGGSEGEEFTFPGDSAAEGDYLYIASEEVGFADFFGFPPDYTGRVMSINGDDAFELFRDAVVIDTFGQVDVDGTGQPWEYADGWAYRQDMTGPDGSAFQLDNWYFSGPDALDGETANDTALTPVPFDSYVGGGPGVALQAGDADQDLDFDQLDLVKVQIAARYLSGLPATWGEGDWNGAPGGGVGDPPPGNQRFDQMDIVAALSAATYLTGSYGAARTGSQGEAVPITIGYHAEVGQFWTNAPGGQPLPSPPVTVPEPSGLVLLGLALATGAAFAAVRFPSHARRVARARSR